MRIRRIGLISAMVTLTAVGIIILTAAVYGEPGALKEDYGKLGPTLYGLVKEYEFKGFTTAYAQAAMRGLSVKQLGSQRAISVILEPILFENAGTIDRGRIERIGARVDAVSKSFVRVHAPIEALMQLAKLPDVRIVRAPTPALELDDGFGTVVSEAVTLTGAGVMQGAGFDGGGAKVAVVDLGFIGLADAIAAGELPASTVALKGDQTGVNIEVGTPHGVGVAEHVIDMAPGAELYCIYVEDEVDLENAAAYIRDNGIRIANHSVGWVNSSYYDDTGPITSIINDSHDDDGVFWTVSAGNSGRRHWRGLWSDPEANDTLNFAGADEGLDISGSYAVGYIFLNWNQYGNSLTDLDIYVRDKNGAIVAQSTAPQTGLQAPAEAVGFNYSSASAPYTIQVHRYSGPVAGLDMTIFSFYHNVEYEVPASALMEPAEAHGSFTVGAIFYANYGQPDPPPESFSSHGPTNDGRPKPDISAPDGTASWTYGASYGTSFSSPTTAGAAALMFGLDPAFTNTDVGDTLGAMALDIGPAGADSIFGAGKLNIIFELDSLPSIESIADVPGDEGLTIEIVWNGSGYDYGASPRPVVGYDIFRRIDPGTGAEAPPAGLESEGQHVGTAYAGRQEPAIMLVGDWDSVGTVAAAGAEQYSAVAPTLLDSTVAGGINYATFIIRARTAIPGLVYESAPDSGYSMDNLPPGPPVSLSVIYSGGGNDLAWGPSPAPDVSFYRIYRDITMGFVPESGLIVHETADTSWTDNVADGWQYFYKVSAVDDAGLEGMPASPQTSTDVPDGAMPKPFALHQNVPNPFNPVTRIRFDIPERSRIRLSIYNVNGQRVTTLIDKEMEAGSREVIWNGVDDTGRNVGSGVYFYRLVAPQFSTSRKMILLR